MGLRKMRKKTKNSKLLHYAKKTAATSGMAAAKNAFYSSLFMRFRIF